MWGPNCSSQITRVKLAKGVDLEPQNTTDISSRVGDGKGTEAGDGAEKIADESICRWKGFLVCNRFMGEESALDPYQRDRSELKRS
jgi:hypothetical protein